MKIRALLATLLTALLLAGGVTAPAAAATGDVTGATLNWGIKQSFRNYIAGPIAHGVTTLSGNVSGAFAWTGGTGTASQSGATGSVGYSGSIHFQGHETGVGTGEYMLDMTVSDVKVVQTSATAANVVVDVVTNSIADPATFTTYSDVVFATADLTGRSASTSTTVGFADAPTVLTADGSAAFSGMYAAGAAIDPLSFSWPVEQAPVPPTPTITVSKSSEISPAGELITITGTGFAPQGTATNGTRQPLSGIFGGTYVAFGKFPENWKPSAGVSSTLRKTGSVVWVVNPENVATVTTTPGSAVAINPDGSFSVQLLVKPGYTGEPSTGNYGIYTYPGSGSTYSAFETYTPISFSTAPTISVSKTTDINPLGETVTVTGYNFGPVGTATNGTRQPLSGKFGGAYVAFGKFPDTWKPSAGVSSSLRKTGSVVWVVNPDDVATVTTTPGSAVAINANGTFSVQLPVTRDYTGEPTTGNYGIYTYPGSGSTYSAFETYTPVTFTAATGTTTVLTASPSTGLIEGGAATLSAQVSPVAAGTVTFRSGSTVLGTATVNGSGLATLNITGLAVGDQTFTADFAPTSPLLFAGSTATTTVAVAAKVVGAGSLSWGVKSSFREYITGNIAQGSITASGVGVSGGKFTFGQSAGGTFDATTGLGSSLYSGSVRFYGHAGKLDVTLSNPSVVVTSATAAVLYVSVNGGASVALANLNLATASRSTPNNTVSYAGAAATLTSQGAAVFSYHGSGFYPVGTALDPVTFVVGSTSTGGSGTTTVAAFSKNKADATPPATTGVTLPGGEDSAALTEGAEYTFEAEGFQANESGVLFVHYSDPVVLSDNLTADAAGTISWTGPLPIGLTGEHTFTFQGSVDRGIVVTILPATTTAAAEGCVVDSGDLTWGFKESFRSYISGSIANGEWTVADGATYETPSFGFTGATGSYDAASASGLVSFPGSINFTGHGGVLDTTVANPQIRFDDEGTASVILDVSGTTQDGETVDQKAVEFATVDLSAATVTNTDGVVTIAGAPAELTAQGSAAFGTYETGEALDPITVSFTTVDCAAVAEEEPAAVDAEPTSSATDLTWLWVVLAVLVVLAIVAVVVIVRRRRVA